MNTKLISLLTIAILAYMVNAICIEPTKEINGVCCRDVENNNICDILEGNCRPPSVLDGTKCCFNNTCINIDAIIVEHNTYFRDKIIEPDNTPPRQPPTTTTTTTTLKKPPKQPKTSATATIPTRPTATTSSTLPITSYIPTLPTNLPVSYSTITIIVIIIIIVLILIKVWRLGKDEEENKGE